MGQFTVRDYRTEICKLSELAMDMDSNAYKAQMKKVEAMQVTMLIQPETRPFISAEINDELYNLNDSAVPLDAPEVQHALWLLETYGYEDDAQEIRGWDWL